MGLNESNVHFISKGCGGAYGDRKPNGEEAWIAALLSKKARMPVNCTFTRHVNATGGATHQGHQKSVIKLGCKKDGEVAAIDAHWYGTSGPIHLQLTYKTDYIRFTSTTVTINVPRTGPFRTVTGMHSCFCSDQIFDQMAYELNMDPYDFRMKVAVTPDRLDQATNRMNGSNALRDCLEEVGKIFDWKNKWAQHKAAGGVGKARLPDGRLWGIGSCYAFNEKGNSDNNRTVIIRVALDGSAHLNIGTGAASSGTHTAVAVVAAEALGTTIDRVNVTVGEAVLAGSGGNQAGSTGTMSNAYGAFEAAKKALGRMMANAATTLKTTTDQLVSENGRIFMKSDPTQFVTHAQAVGSLAIIESGNGAILGMNLKRDYLSWRRGQANTVRSSVADMCEIAVDEETGEIEILRWDMVDDVGRVLFPKGVQAQLNGGMVMKIGVTLTGWEQLFDPGTGATLNGNFIDQKNPTPLDVPVDRITAVAYESNNAASVYGGIGCGEPPVLNYVVVHNAFYNATGKRLTNSVLYPARVLAALGKI
jgi:xanthine dehydrogenase YagR molybdenum-binding subunit